MAQQKKLRILAAGDIHGDTSLTKRLAERAKKENVDLVILTGDLTMAEQSTDNIIGPFAKAGKKVLLIPGNHETIATADFLAEVYPDTKNIHGYAMKFGDVGIFGCGGADIGIHALSERQIMETLKKGYDRLKKLPEIKKKIMVTHMHAAGSKAEWFGFKGSDSIRKAIETFKPDIMLFGHIHESEGIEEKIGKTFLLNPGREGKIIEI